MHSSGLLWPRKLSAASFLNLAMYPSSLHLIQYRTELAGHYHRFFHRWGGDFLINPTGRPRWAPGITSSLPLWAATITSIPDDRLIITDRHAGADPAACKEVPKTASRRYPDAELFCIIAALNRIWFLLLHNARLLYIGRACMA